MEHVVTHSDHGGGALWCLGEVHPTLTQAAGIPLLMLEMGSQSDVYFSTKKTEPEKGRKTRLALFSNTLLEVWPAVGLDLQCSSHEIHC